MGVAGVTAKLIAERGRSPHDHRSRVTARRPSLPASVSHASAQVLETAAKHALSRGPSDARWPERRLGRAGEGHDSLLHKAQEFRAAVRWLIWLPYALGGAEVIPWSQRARGTLFLFWHLESAGVGAEGAPAGGGDPCSNLTAMCGVRGPNDGVIDRCARSVFPHIGLGRCCRGAPGFGEIQRCCWPGALGLSSSYLSFTRGPQTCTFC